MVSVIFVLHLTCTVLIWMHPSLAHILRLPCKSYGNFSIKKMGFALNGHVLFSIQVSTVEECKLQCLHHPLCSSLNWKVPSGDINCQINEKSTENPFDQVALSSSSEWTYLTTNYSEENIGDMCNAKNPCPIGHKCMDTCFCPGYQCHRDADCCQSLHNLGFREDKKYDIYRPDIGIFPVRCDMTTDGGGWIVFQRRVDASVDFFRGWNDYKEGFGDMNGNFWLGLEKLHTLAAPGKGAILRVDMKHMDFAEKKYATYSLFEISGESDGYRLKVEGYSGDAGDGLKYHNNMMFSTKDKDHDSTDAGSCAMSHKGGWWYNACHSSNLNAFHPEFVSPEDLARYMGWFSIKGEQGKVTFSEMKIRY